ncbi:hypothetical protein GH984_03775 [Spiribacter sp. C176]|uniref:DNA polymerase III subunit psi n=1 Tax=Spiribacter salilacus TaxID=2664894 RepID=A0A6N7QMR4_9GAMM|nr:hypothetical protein [Spiribacter salilacus]MRH77815.1 hypothetical protein [Spiribacter salilacus]
MQGLSHSQQAALDAMGITRWQRQMAPAPVPLQVISDGVLKGPEAKLLDAMLAAIGLTVGADVQIATSTEKALAQTPPSPVWLVLGEQAAASLQGQGPIVLVTKTPAELLRAPLAKARVWEDLRRLRRALQEVA